MHGAGNARALARSLLAPWFVAAIAACGTGNAGDAPSASVSGSAAAPGFGDGPVVDRVVFSVVEELASCDVEHRGALVDFGTDMTRGRVRPMGDDPAARRVEHHGGTWSVVDQRTFEMSFTLQQPSRIFVGARIEPFAAKSVAFFVDDQSMGGAKLKAGEPRVIETEATEFAFDAGEHVLTARFSPARVRDAYAHVDWVRIGFPDELKATYGPPTLSDIQQADAALGRVPHRALRLRHPTVVRCPLRIPAGARFRAALGLQGAKEAEAEVAVLVDGKPPITLLRRSLKGGEGAAWDDVDASLDAFAGQLVQLELRTAGTPATGRVLFGDPEVLVSSAAPEAVKPAQIVILLVLSGVEKNELPGYADRAPTHLERLSKLAERATLYQHHRGSTNVVTGNLATMMTGLPPEVHTVTDAGTALPQAVPTLSQRARDASIQTALFTGVPHSFEPMGFMRGLTRAVAISPAEGDNRDPLSEAATWLAATLSAAKQAKILLVVHARGGHPPWSVAQKQLDLLPPDNYTGDIQPRRAAQQLGALRRRKAKADLSEQDRVRIGALHQIALVQQDRAVGQLLDALDTADVTDRSLIIVTSELSSGLSTLFADTAPYEERALDLPLYVIFPGGKLAGRRVDQATGIEDISHTVAAALELEPLRDPWGRDLAHVGSGVALAHELPRFALFGDAFSVRWDNLLLRERGQGRATLCDLTYDPTCAFDRRPIYPQATAALLRALAAHKAKAAGTPFVRLPVTLDDDTLAAMRVWGSME